MESLTKFELLQEVGKFYTGFLDTNKALKLYEIEYGYIPKIIDDVVSKDSPCVSEDTLKTLNLDECVTVEALVFMKKLQDSGECNMIVGNIREIIQQRLLVDRSEARMIHMAYMNHYNRIYYPEELI